MALTKAQVREILSAAGVEGEGMSHAVESILDGHIASVNALREEIERYKPDAEKLAGVQKDLDAARAELEASKKDPYKVKYEALKEDFNKFKADQAKKEAHSAKESAYRALLKAAGISEKRVESVLRVSDVDGLELDEKGAVKGAEQLTASLKEEWADFVETTEVLGAETPFPPAHMGGPAITKEEIMNIKDTEERQKAMAENPGLFGI